MQTDWITGQQILVVDDDEGILDSFEAMLGEDYHLAMADNGATALEMLMVSHPRLLFLDLKIPRLNGWEVMRWIRDRNICITVVVITALPQNEYEKRAMQYGVYRYLRKPLDVDEVETIATAVLH
jgi:DNA-binding response OmpR family regulator